MEDVFFGFLDKEYLVYEIIMNKYYQLYINNNININSIRVG